MRIVRDRDCLHTAFKRCHHPADFFASAGFDATDQQVIDRMLTIWTNFAKTGDPSIDGEIDYPLYDAAVESYVEISATAEIKAGLGDALND